MTSLEERKMRAENGDDGGPKEIQIMIALLWNGACHHRRIYCGWNIKNFEFIIPTKTLFLLSQHLALGRHKVERNRFTQRRWKLRSYPLIIALMLVERLGEVMM